MIIWILWFWLWRQKKKKNLFILHSGLWWGIKVYHVWLQIVAMFTKYFLDKIWIYGQGDPPKNKNKKTHVLMGDIINPKNIRCVGNGRCWSSSQRCGMPQGCCSSCCSRTCVGSSGSYCCCCSSSGQCYPPQCSCCKTKVRVRQACNVTTSCKVCSVQDIN